MLKYICRNVSFLPGRRNWAPRCQVWRSWKHRIWSFAFQEHGGVTKEPGAWISAVRSMYTICETALRWMKCWGLRTVYFALRTLSTSSVTPRAPHTTHFERRPVARNPTHLERLTLPTSSVTLTASHLERLTLPTSSVGPSQRTIALVNMPFSPVPKARGRGRRGLWGPCKW